jgi:mono/diheme cytochrome c family protein
MHKALAIVALAGLSIPLILVAQSSGNVALPQDKGPAKIDVSAYPAAQQQGYKVFADKCAKCHTIARPINTTMTKDEWERYVKRMMHKPNSGISDNQGKTIFDFLAYDQATRKDKNPSAFFKSLSDDEIEKLKATQH